jgi:acetyl esterase
MKLPLATLLAFLSYRHCVRVGLMVTAARKPIFRKVPRSDGGARLLNMETPYINPDAARLLEAVASAGGVKLRQLSLNDARKAAVAMAQQLDLPCMEECAVANLTIAGPLPIPARLYSPFKVTSAIDDVAMSTPVIIYAHGGGWVLGDLDFCDSLCRYLATRSRYRVVSLDYRLAPEHPFPAAFMDVQTTARWVRTSPRELGQPVGGIALAGDSAGGGLVAAAALTHPGDAPIPVLAVLMFYPVTDISRVTLSYERFAEGFLLEAADMRYFADSYVPARSVRNDPRVSPLLAPDVASFPPATLLACGLDVLRDEGRAFAARLAQAGVDITYIEARGQIHGIATMRGAMPSARTLIDRAIDDFRRHIEQSAALVPNRP